MNSDSPSHTPREGADVDAILGRIASLAMAAAEIECRQAEHEGIYSMRHSLGLGIFLAGCEFSNLIGSARAPDDLAADPALAAHLDDPVALLLEAERLARTLPGLVGRPGAARAVVHLVDATRETSQFEQAYS